MTTPTLAQFDPHEGIPTPGTLVNRRGASTLRAKRRDYPLYATCATCGDRIRCADGSADWGHLRVAGPFVTKTGKALTDADVEALADEAERGYDVSRLGRTRREQFRFVVSVTTDSIEHAEQVMAERLGYDETYGFDYRIEWEAAP